MSTASTPPPNTLSGKNVLVMGLGLHGGGLETVRYLLKAGASVHCTDLRTAEHLAPTLAALKGLPLTFTLGEHRQQDFDAADLIIKNPAVPASSPWLQGCSNIETDISLFLKNSPAPLIAVTGSKGKSTVVSALCHILKTALPNVYLGGNITISPLSFLHELTAETPVILELSSWQLADIQGRGLLKPQTACITNLMHDHQNRYDSFEQYEADKKVIFENLEPRHAAVFPDNHYGRKWAGETPAQSYLVHDNGARAYSPRSAPSKDPASSPSCGAPFSEHQLSAETLLPPVLKVPGSPFRTNMLFAAVLARLRQIPEQTIREALARFPGVPYRMEMFLEKGGIRFYDDTAATIPDAAAAAIQAMDRPCVLIAGGNDKNLNFSPFTPQVLSIPRRVVLLEGSATAAMAARLEDSGLPYSGPFSSMEQAVAAAVEAAKPGDAVLLSPGATSFGMFHHEFERGDAFKAACRKITEAYR